MTSEQPLQGRDYWGKAKDGDVGSGNVALGGDSAHLRAQCGLLAHRLLRCSGEALEERGELGVAA